MAHGTFDPGFHVYNLERFSLLLITLVDDVPRRDWRWKPSPNDWAIVEILGHLAREEREDFRPRLERTLRDPTEAWPPIDPEGDVARHKDIDGDVYRFFEEFVRARQDNLAWLESLGPLEELAWDNAHAHPRGFTIRAGDLLCAWADHDALHARQIVKRRHQMIERAAGRFTCVYAGDW
ncbi:MAG: DinB family protein [Phycisphaerales bacterium JB064]